MGVTELSGLLHLSSVAWLLLLILVANGAPLLVSRYCSGRFSQPVDFGLVLADGNPLFGPSKTWRGLVVSIVVTSMVSSAAGLGPGLGIIVAVFAMTGDLFSSFIKRRLSIRPSGMFTGGDQIPESLLPALAVKPLLHMGWTEVLAVVALFLVLNRALSIALHKLRIRDQPY